MMNHKLGKINLVLIEQFLANGIELLNAQINRT